MTCIRFNRAILLVLILAISNRFNCNAAPSESVVKPEGDNVIEEDDTDETSEETDYEMLALLAKNVEEQRLNPSPEYGIHVQGDMVLTDEQKEESADESPTRTGVIHEHMHWPKNSEGFVQVPYTFKSFSES